MFPFYYNRKYHWHQYQNLPRVNLLFSSSRRYFHTICLTITIAELKLTEGRSTYEMGYAGEVKRFIM